MILEGIETNVNGNVESKACKIEANPVMYDILSNRLYRNKVRAVVRELSTNAVDSHKKAGNTDTPIKVQLPTILEPSFIIRDYGTGLKEQDIYDLYMTYGASDKRDSNLFNGALGVGSKSPFAYTQAFSVTSFFEGEATTYSVFSENGSPKIAKLGSVQTKEHTGLSIEVPVDDIDISRFTKEAEYVYTFLGFPVETNFKIERLFELTDTEFKGEGWAIYPKLDDAYIVMAGIGYNLKNLNVADASILDTSGLVIEVETGDVQFAASREELSLSPDTIKKLQEIAEKLNADFQVKAKEVVAGESGLLDIVRITEGMPKYLKTLIAKDYPDIQNSYWGAMTLNVPMGLHISAKKSWGNMFQTHNSFPQGYIKDPESWTVVLLDILNRKFGIQDTHFPNDKKVLYIKSGLKKTKENIKSRFDDSIKLLGIKDYTWASDYALGTDKVSNSGSKITAPRVTILDKTWGYHKVTREQNGSYTIQDGSGTLGNIDLKHTDILPIPTYRGDAVFENNGYDQTHYGFLAKLAKSVKFFETLKVGHSIYIVGVPASQVQTMLNAGGKDWKEYFVSDKKTIIYNTVDSVYQLRRYGWDIADYINNTYVEELKYLPKDIKKELDKINTLAVKGKVLGLNGDDGLEVVLTVLTESFKLKHKVSVVRLTSPEYFKKKYEIATEGWRKSARRYSKIADISWKQLQKVDKES